MPHAISHGSYGVRVAPHEISEISGDTTRAHESPREPSRGHESHDSRRTQSHARTPTQKPRLSTPYTALTEFIRLYGPYGDHTAHKALMGFIRPERGTYRVHTAHTGFIRGSYDPIPPLQVPRTQKKNNDSRRTQSHPRTPTQKPLLSTPYLG